LTTSEEMRTFSRVLALYSWLAEADPTSPFRSFVLIGFLPIALASVLGALGAIAGGLSGLGLLLVYVGNGVLASTAKQPWTELHARRPP